MRRKTTKLFCGNVGIGGDSAVTVQSMTNTDTRNVQETVKQIKSLEEAGCDLIRVAVPDHEAAIAIKMIKKEMVMELHRNIKNPTLEEILECDAWARSEVLREYNR